MVAVSSMQNHQRFTWKMCRIWIYIYRKAHTLVSHCNQHEYPSEQREVFIIKRTRLTHLLPPKLLACCDSIHWWCLRLSNVIFFSFSIQFFTSSASSSTSFCFFFFCHFDLFGFRFYFTIHFCFHTKIRLHLKRWCELTVKFILACIHTYTYMCVCIIWFRQ